MLKFLTQCYRKIVATTAAVTFTIGIVLVSSAKLYVITKIHRLSFHVSGRGPSLSMAMNSSGSITGINRDFGLSFSFAGYERPIRNSWRFCKFNLQVRAVVFRAHRGVHGFFLRMTCQCRVMTEEKNYRTVKGWSAYLDLSGCATCTRRLLLCMMNLFPDISTIFATYQRLRSRHWVSSSCWGVAGCPLLSSIMKITEGMTGLALYSIYQCLSKASSMKAILGNPFWACCSSIVVIAGILSSVVFLSPSTVIRRDSMSAA